MKNITSELEDRLRALETERQRLQERLTGLGAIENAVKVLLEEERAHWTTQQLELLPVRTQNGHKVIGRTPKSRFLVKALSDGKARALKELADIARVENVDFQGKNPSRALHFALIGLRNNGYAQMVGRSVWQLTGKALASQDSSETAIPESPTPGTDNPAVAGL